VFAAAAADKTLVTYLWQRAKPGPAIEAPGSVQTGFIARGIGFAFLGAGATGLVSVAFPAARYGSTQLAGLTASAALGIGVLLLLLRPVWRPGRMSPFVLALATATVSLGVYAGGAPDSGAMFFYFWVVPYAFALPSRLQAALQAAWMAFCFAVVLAVQVHLHPGIESAAVLAGLWFIAIVTVCVVGTLVLVLSRSLREVDRRFRRAFQDSRIGAAFITTDGRWLEMNDALARMLGRDAGELVDTAITDITAVGDRAATEEAVAIAGRGFYEYEKRYLRPDGEIVWVEVSSSLITPEAGDPYIFAQYRDITEHKLDRDTLAHQAVHDPLTGLFNRTLLLDRLETALVREDAVAVILLDLDGFKTVNDSLGHHVGDHVLKEMAPRLAGAIAPSDTLARLGGDEFVVLCERLVGPFDAVDRASRLADVIAEPVELAPGRFHSLSASVGVAVAGGQGYTADALLRDADSAMYRAKARGRGYIELFDHSMRDRAIARLQLEHDLQVAIEKQQFVLEYQPIVDSRTLRPILLETLIRWDHPTRGRMAPDEFIPLAEETGMIARIGGWVIGTACAQLVRWQEEAPELQLTINVSPFQLSLAGFVEHVARVIRRSQIRPGSLCLEITESAILKDDAPAAALAELKALGVRILLDDFGTGYSSLAYLARYPIDTIKIDRGFVARLDGSDGSAAIVKAILAIAHELGLGAVGEGVETSEQVVQLRALRCPLIQGQAVSHPLPTADVGPYLAHEHPHLRLTEAG
jgi:diguanylate cyclase (GGDEF)-like protein/PAS domain S-box-containing protein